MSPVIPAPVPVPLPAPPWLLESLLVFTFILHLLPMNLLLGGTVLLTVSGWLGRRDHRHRELVRRASRAMPPVVAFTITLGVAPLLFLQLLYGQFFYTSSVLMAWMWLAVVLLVMLGYYGVYWFSLQQDELGPRAFWVTLATAVIFLHVAYIFTQNISFMLRPEDFYAQFFERDVGNYLGSFEPVRVARLMHFFVGSLAVAGLGLALLARAWTRDSPEVASWARGFGIRWFMAATAVQFAGGVWFLFSLPREIRKMFLGGHGLSTALLVVAVAFAVAALIAAPRSLMGSTILILTTIVLMAIIRHLVRIAYLRPYFDPATLPVSGQWGVFVLFVVLLVAGVGTIGWMLYQFFRPSVGKTSLDRPS